MIAACRSEWGLKCRGMLAVFAIRRPGLPAAPSALVPILAIGFFDLLANLLFVLATGRGLEYYDAPAVRKIVREAKANDYRFSSIIVGITKSAPFTMRTASNQTGL